MIPYLLFIHLILPYFSQRLNLQAGCNHGKSVVFAYSVKYTLHFTAVFDIIDKTPAKRKGM